MIKYKELSLPGKLIYINVAVYALTQFYRLFLVLFCVSGFDWQNYLALHANLSDFVYAPWTLLTYFFCHADIGTDFFHIVFNMLWLWWFGNFFLRYHTGRQLLSVYLLGGLFAGVFYLFVYNIFPYFIYEKTFAAVVGASGAIFGLIVAVAMRSPNEMLYLNFIVRTIGVKMKWVAVAAIVINLISLPNTYNVGGIICHIGGVIWGLVYGYSELCGVNITGWFDTLCDRIANGFKPRPKMRATRGGSRTVNADRRKDMEYNAEQKSRQAHIDAILDKISKSGYEGLSAEEKQILFDASQRRKK